MNSKGMTLVEVLSALALMSILSVIGYSLLFGGLSSYQSIMDENELRDEADYIMAYLISELYTLRNSEIREKHLPREGTTDYYVVKSNQRKTGMIGTELLIDDQPISLTNQQVALTPESSIVETAPAFLEINLVLKHRQSKKELKLYSNIRLIDDRRED